jgi:hypothetical protein
VLLGAHACRGLKDNLYFAHGDLATNQRPTERLVRLVRDLGYEPATLAEARTISGFRAKACQGPSLPSAEPSRRPAVSTAIKRQDTTAAYATPLVFEDDKLVRFSSVQTDPISTHSRTSFPGSLTIRRRRSRELFVSRFRYYSVLRLLHVHRFPLRSHL